MLSGGQVLGDGVLAESASTTEAAQRCALQRGSTTASRHLRRQAIRPFARRDATRVAASISGAR